MPLSVTEADVRDELLPDHPTAHVDLANEDAGNTVIVTIDTPGARYAISSAAILATLSNTFPDLQNAIRAGDQQRILALLQSNVTAVSAALLGYAVSGAISPSFKLRQSVTGVKRYHCNLQHHTQIERQPVSLFDFLLAPGGEIVFHTQNQLMKLPQFPADTPARSVRITADAFVETDQQDLPFFSSAVFGVSLREIPHDGFLDLLKALTRLLVQNLSARLVVAKTIVTIREIGDAEEWERVRRTAAAAPTEREPPAHEVATDATVDAIEHLGTATRLLTGGPLRYLMKKR
jgi:hypothetical protein